MFKYLSEHAEDLVAVQLTGKLDKSDYDSLIPEMEEKIRRYGKINLYWEMVDFEGWELSGFWQDVQFDVKHARDFNRVALVGGKKWESWLTNMLNPFTSAEVRYFDLSERQSALDWVQGKAVGQMV